MEYVWPIEEDEDRLFKMPHWTLDKLQPSFGNNVRLSVRSVFDDIKTTFAAGGTKVLTDVCGVLLLTGRFVQATFDLDFSDAAQSSGLTEKGDVLGLVEAAETERDKSLQRPESVGASLAAEPTELPVGQRATGKLQAKLGVVLRRIRNATWKVPHLELDISHVCKRLVVKTDSVTRGC